MLSCCIWAVAQTGGTGSASGQGSTTTQAPSTQPPSSTPLSTTPQTTPSQTMPSETTPPSTVPGGRLRALRHRRNRLPAPVPLQPPLRRRRRMRFPGKPVREPRLRRTRRPTIRIHRRRLRRRRSLTAIGTRRARTQRAQAPLIRILPRRRAAQHRLHRTRNIYRLTVPGQKSHLRGALLLRAPRVARRIMASRGDQRVTAWTDNR